MELTHLQVMLIEGEKLREAALYHFNSLRAQLDAASLIMDDDLIVLAEKFMTKFESGVEILVKHLAAIKAEWDRQNVTEEGVERLYVEVDNLCLLFKGKRQELTFMTDRIRVAKGQSYRKEEEVCTCTGLNRSKASTRFSVDDNDLFDR